MSCLCNCLFPVCEFHSEARAHSWKLPVYRILQAMTGSCRHTLPSCDHEPRVSCEGGTRGETTPRRDLGAVTGPLLTGGEGTPRTTTAARGGKGLFGGLPACPGSRADQPTCWWRKHASRHRSRPRPFFAHIGGYGARGGLGARPDPARAVLWEFFFVGGSTRRYLGRLPHAYYAS